MALIPLVLGAVGTYGGLGYGAVRATGSILNAITRPPSLSSGAMPSSATAAEAGAGITAVEALAKKRRAALLSGGRTIFSTLSDSLLGSGSTVGTQTLLGS